MITVVLFSILQASIDNGILTEQQLKEELTTIAPHAEVKADQYLQFNLRETPIGDTEAEVLSALISRCPTLIGADFKAGNNLTEYGLNALRNAVHGHPKKLCLIIGFGENGKPNQIAIEPNDDCEPDFLPPENNVQAQ